MTELLEKSKDAVENFLNRKGCTVVARDFGGKKLGTDFVFTDDGVLVFADVYTRRGAFPPENIPQSARKRMEKNAAKYLQKHKAEDMTIRFDCIGVNIIGNDQALIRHNINAFNRNFEALLERLLEDGEITHKAYKMIIGGE